MKLRKILAGFLAGAIAMTSSVVMSVTAGAELAEAPAADEFGVSMYVMDSSSWSWGADGDAKFDSATNSLTLTGDAAAAAAAAEATATAKGTTLGEKVGNAGFQFYFGDTIAISENQTVTADITYTVKDSSDEVVKSGNVTISKYYDETKAEFATENNQVEVYGYESITMSEYAALGTFTITAEISNINLETEEADTTVYEEKAYTATSMYSTNVYKFEGTWDATAISGSKASLTVKATSTGGCGFHIESLEGTILVENVWVNSGDSYTVLLSEIDVTGGIQINSWGETYSIDGIVIKNEEGKTVYTPTVAPSAYSITINVSSENGTVTSDKKTAVAGETVTLTVTPAENYQLKADTLLVIVEAGVEQVDVTENEDGTYSFIMPECSVAISAEFIVREYKLTLKETEHGTVDCFIVNTIDAEGAAPADVEVEIAAIPEECYKFGSADIEGVTTGKTFTITERTFTMPAEDVIVTPKFVVDVDHVKVIVDPSVAKHATVTKPSTYTVADYKAEIEKTVAALVVNDIKITVDTSALKETKATEDATGSITGTVTFKAGEETITTLTANVTLDKVPTDPVEIAAEAVEAYLAKVTFDNDFHATNQAEAIKAEVAKVAPEVRVDASFTVKIATEEAAGSVKGTIMLVAEGSELKTIEVNETIAKLPAKVYADNQAALEELKADGTVLTQTATQADGNKSQRYVQKVTIEDVKKATGVRYDFIRSDGKKCSITGDYQCYYKSVAGVQAGTDEAFLSVTMKNIPKDMIVICKITLLYN